MSDGKCIVKYLRLSLEDEDMLDESNSITNQRIVIKRWKSQHNYSERPFSIRQESYRG